MEIHNENQGDSMDQFIKEHEERRKRGKFFGGLLFIIAGSLLLARQLNVAIPDWAVSWQMLLIGIGLAIGAKHGFRSGGWFFPLIIGTFFMISEFVAAVHIGNLWPAFIILIGLFMIFKPKRTERSSHKWRKNFTPGAFDQTSAEEKIDVVSVFSGVKRNIFTKNFKGGEITCVFGGAEVNLLQADFEGTITIEATAVFGGAKILIPAHWTIQNEVSCIAGGFEDSRPTNVTPDPSKVVLLKGTCVFGGVEVNSY